MQKTIKSKSTKSKKKKYDNCAFLYLLPTLLLIVTFVAVPMVMTLGYSFTDWTGFAGFNLIGFRNFEFLITDPIFWQSIRLTFLWVGLSVTVLPIASLILALIIEYLLPFRRLRTTTRILLFMPQLVSAVAVALLWRHIYNPHFGLIVSLGRAFGIVAEGDIVNLLGNPDVAIFYAFVPVIWAGAGFGMIVLCAAMQNISSDIVEAGMIDGCTRLKIVGHIVIPLIRPTLGLLATLNLIGGFNAFATLHALTGGGPGTATQITALYIFREAFQNNRFGYSSALSFVLMVITLVFGIIFFSLSKKIQHYN